MNNTLKMARRSWTIQGLKSNRKDESEEDQLMQDNKHKIVVSEQDIEELDEFTCLGEKVCKERGARKDLKTDYPKQETRSSNWGRFGVP